MYHSDETSLATRPIPVESRAMFRLFAHTGASTSLAPREAIATRSAATRATSAHARAASRSEQRASGTMSGNALRRGAHVAMRAAMKDGARGASMTPRGIAAPVLGGWSAASEGCVDATTARARDAEGWRVYRRVDFCDFLARRRWRVGEKGRTLECDRDWGELDRKNFVCGTLTDDRCGLFDTRVGFQRTCERSRSKR